jgi:hypothetical protein
MTPLRAAPAMSVAAADEPPVPTVTLLPFGRLAQLGERLPYKQEVGGSIPSPPTPEVPARRVLPFPEKQTAAALSNGNNRFPA